ncbi:hypothetical protein BJ165DRAFT_1340054, partial [Panaeolus papilionaceus]
MKKVDHILDQIRSTRDSQGVRVLRKWANRGRWDEVDEEMVRSIRRMSTVDAEVVVKELKEPRNVVVRVKNNSVVIPMRIQLGKDSSTSIHALLDSGATGCYVHEDFVKAHSLPLTKLPHPIAIYNADGSRNVSHSIRFKCTLRVTMEDHTEDITCSVANIGT